MSENELIEIKSSKFDNAKKDLQDLSSKFSVNSYLQKVETDGGLFGWFEHNVTGYELNRSLGEIQKVFVNIGTSLTTVHEQFEKVYTMLDALDTDYIHRILDSLRLANKGIEDAKAASDAAKNASDDALAAYNKALDAHEELKKHYEILNLTVSKLQEKSAKIDNLETQLFETKAEFKNINCNIETTLDECKNLISESKVILDKIDKINDDHENLKSEYDSIKSSIENLQKDIESQTLDLRSELEKKQSSEIKVLTDTFNSKIDNILSKFNKIKKVQYFFIGLSSITFCLTILALLFIKGIL